jgi:hypothetical protein
MLQASYERGTKDSDVLETVELGEDAKIALLALAGPDTEIHRRHRLYVDVVSNGLPFLPGAPTWHPRLALPHLDVDVLDVVDVVVSKLKRFNANDQSDIAAMVERDLVPHEALVSRFVLAVDAFACDARADDLPRYVSHLHRVERDLYAVCESVIELPSWI